MGDSKKLRLPWKSSAADSVVQASTSRRRKKRTLLCGLLIPWPPQLVSARCLGLCIVVAASYAIVIGETRIASGISSLDGAPLPRQQQARPAFMNEAAVKAAAPPTGGGPPSPSVARRVSEIPTPSLRSAPALRAVVPLNLSSYYRRVIKLTPNEHLLFQGRQKKLCELLREVERHSSSTATTHAEEELASDDGRRTAKEEGVDSELSHRVEDDEEDGRIRRTGSEAQHAGEVPMDKGRILLNMTTSCVGWGNKRTVGSLGVGNLVLGVYAVRLAAITFGFDLIFRCREDHRHAAGGDGGGGDDKIGPIRWLQGHFLATDDDGEVLLEPPERGAYRPPLPGRNQTCRGMGHNPVHYMSEHVRRDFRTMAVDIFGPRDNIPESGRYYADSSSSWSSPTGSSSLHGADLDDVAIHLRCGDILYAGGSNYGLLPFRSYVSRLGGTKNFNGTIGIVTIPFNEPHRLRGRDRRGAGPCRRIVAHLVRYLETHLPGAVGHVTVRNGPGETSAVAMARLVMAKTATFCGPTTFGVFPSIASFGTAYVHSGATNYFVAEVAERYDDVDVMDEPLLTSTTMMKNMSLNETIQWLLRT